MANIEYWIQLENRPWDASPRNRDRLTGRNMKEITTKDPVDAKGPSDSKLAELKGRSPQ